MNNNLIRLVVLADIAREASDAAHEQWVQEMSQNSEKIKASSTDQRDELIRYRDYLWQVKEVMSQLSSLNSSGIMPQDYAVVSNS